jgi:hypothetical protein
MYVIQAEVTKRSNPPKNTQIWRPSRGVVVWPRSLIYGDTRLGLLVGFSEPVSKTFNPFTLPDDVDFVSLFDEEADHEQLAAQLEPMLVAEAGW